MTIFRPPLAALDLAHARRALELCAICYDDNPVKLDRRLAYAGAALIRAYDVDDAQAFLIRADGTLWLVYQGSVEVTDWWRNLTYVKTDFPGGGRVHAGFLTAFAKTDVLIRADLTDFPNTPKIGVGHSLGAAVMQEAMVAYGLDEGFAFGSPRVGNDKFCERITEPLWRFEHRSDPVCYVPPRTSPAQAGWALLHFRKPTLYDRAGTAILVDGALHRIHHYQRSVGAWLEAFEIERAAFAARRVP